MSWQPKSAVLLLIVFVLQLAPAAAEEGEAPVTALWGGSLARNMVSAEKGLPTTWDVDSGQHILWSVELGSQTYGGPLIVGDKVLVGTNNQGERNPEVKGDKGILMAFNRADGEFLWQIAHDKLPAGRVNDWPQQGICSTPFVEGDRLWYVSNRCELVCADLEGKIIWSLDMIDELDVFPHNLATSSPLGVGDLIFVETSNGVDEGHFHNPSPFAPSFIAVNKHTGEVVWEDASPGENILHGQWSNPAYGVIGGKPQVIFPGGDGWVYSFEPETGELIWKFDCNPKDSVWELGGRGTRNNLVSTPVVYGDRVYIGVGQDPEHGEGAGHFWAIDATGEGDITETGVVWHFGDDNFNRTMSTAAIDAGLLYISDLSGFVYCLDLETGKRHWTYDTFAAIWGSPFVADGKVYIGDEDGDVAILKAGTEMELLAETNMGSAVYTTPVAKDGTLYIGTRNRLFAIGESASE